MSVNWLLPKRIFDGETLREGWALKIENGVVSQMVPMASVPQGAKVQQSQSTISPGFIDLQVNGGGGVLFNAAPTAPAIQTIAEAHRSFGTIGILPTIISDTPETLAQAVDAALQAWGQPDMPGVLGLHIEGPHLAAIRRGTHAACHLRPMDQSTLDHVRRLRDAHVPVMITLAPEVVQPAQIKALAEMGAVVSIGHSDTTAEGTREALKAGAKAGTHLFNAMSPMLNRSPGVVGALINSDAYTGIIVDGYHVAEEMIALAIRARPVPDRMFLVSDAMPTIGGPDRFNLYGHEVHLEDGKLVNAEGSLAGAHLTQAQGLHRLVNRIGLDPAAALRMAVTIPARVMGLDRLAEIEGRASRDLVCLDDDLSFTGYLDHD